MTTSIQRKVGYMSENTDNLAKQFNMVEVNPYISFEELRKILLQKKNKLSKGAYYQPNAHTVRRRFLKAGVKDGAKIYACSIPGDSYFVDRITEEYPFEFLRYMPISVYDTLDYEGKAVFYMDLATGTACHCSFKCIIEESGLAFLIEFDGPETLHTNSDDYHKRFVFLNPASDITKKRK